MGRRGSGPDPRRIILYSVGAVVIALLLISTFSPQSATDPDDQRGVAPALRAYRAATGTFVLPSGPDVFPAFAESERFARQHNQPLAFTMWVTQADFEARAWRDVIQAGRLPLARPPQVDFVRELAVLVWPVAGIAPDRVMRANGFAVESVRFQHTALELRVLPDTGGMTPATPAGAASIAPYGLFTIPRSQWPLPAPSPTEPPLLVTLAP
jgi:hypothetical protein